MSNNKSDNNLVTEAQCVLHFWEQHPELKLKDSTCAAFKLLQEAFRTTGDEVVAQENRLRLVLAERDAQSAEVKDVVTRLRSAVRGFYGPDSSEYHEVGGTRQSDRKRPVRAKNGSSAPAMAPALAIGNGNGR
jgi:hypothetical protein